MKIKVVVLGLTAACIAGSVVAQETDDMYFNSKDRAKLNAQKASETTVAPTYSMNKKKTDVTVEEEEINSTEGYSARDVNPEFTSRSNSEFAQNDNEDYFVTNYRYANSNNLNQFNNNYNNWYNSQWYRNSYFGPSMYSWNSPYYYNSWGNPWCSPYYQSGWYGSLSYYWGSPYYGNSWDYGYGGGWGYPYYGNYYGSNWGSSWGYNNWGYNNYWGGSTVIIVNGEGGRGSVYGKRPDRGGMVYSNTNAGTRTRSQIISRDGSGNSGGRVSTTGRTQTQDEYYNRSWRRSSEQPSNTNSNSSWSNSNRSSTWDNSNRSSSFERSSSPTRSSGSSASPSGGGTRSGGTSSGSGSGGRTRGRD